jgi:hypothetical protein
MSLREAVNLVLEVYPDAIFEWPEGEVSISQYPRGPEVSRRYGKPARAWMNAARKIMKKPRRTEAKAISGAKAKSKLSAPKPMRKCCKPEKSGPAKDTLRDGRQKNGRCRKTASEPAPEHWSAPKPATTPAYILRKALAEKAARTDFWPYCYPP